MPPKDPLEEQTLRYAALLRRIGAGSTNPEFSGAAERVSAAIAKNKHCPEKDTARAMMLLLEYIISQESWRWQAPTKQAQRPASAQRPTSGFVATENQDSTEDDGRRVERLKLHLGISGAHVVSGPGGRRLLLPREGW